MVCSFAKFLALGLIASDATIQGVSAKVALQLQETYQKLTGISFPDANESTDDAAQTDLISKLQESHKSLEGDYKSLKGENKEAKIDELTGALINLWQVDQDAFNFGYQALAPGTSAEKIKRCKDHLLVSLKDRYQKPITDAKDATTWAKIQHVKKEIYKTRLTEHNSIAGVTQESAKVTTTWTPEILAVEKKILDAKEEQQQEAAVDDGTAAKKKAEEEAAERAEAVGGFFGVFLGLVGLTLGFLMSPCVQFDFNTGKTATNWATGTPDEEWTQMDMYKEAYKTDKTPGEWRDEVFGLPEEQPADSAKATSSALTLVPVVVLAGGVFAVARRGLKRRAQKKAKRVSRAQQKLHEDL